MANAIGPDVSFYEDEESTPEGIDFFKMRERADFVIVRVGQNRWIDPDFATNWKEAKKAGIPRGSYWFYDSRVEPQEQARLWRDALGDDRGELPLCADFEENYGGPHAGWEKWYAFLEYLKDLMPEKEIILYTGYYYWREHAPSADTQASSLEYFHQYPLWIARYGASEPLVPAPWDKDEWMLWQFTEAGDGPSFGAESLGIDLNYFNGDAAAFRKRFNLTDAPPATPLKYKVDLSLRQTPDLTGDVVSTLVDGETVERLEISADDAWYKLKKESGEEGWHYIKHLIVEQGEEPEPEPEPDKKWGRVLPAVLNVRQGDSSLYEIVGTLKKDQVVKILEFNSAKTWVRVQEYPNGLVGWCDANYLVFLDEMPDPSPDPEPEPEPNKWYVVTPYALNVRKGPSTTYEVAGTLKKGEVVEKIEENDNGKWYKIRNEDGLVGWAYASYLAETEAPENPAPTPDPDPDPDPEPEPPPDLDVDGDPFLGRFEVTAYSLNVRSGPGTSNEKVGSVKKGDVVMAVEANEDGSWRKIVADELTGWCSAGYLVRYPKPIAVNQKYFSGAVRYIREINKSPRDMIVHVFVIDLKKKLKFLVTPPVNNSDKAPLCAATTSEFLEGHNLDIAINGDGFTHVDPSDVPGISCPNGRDLLNPNSFAASYGKIYSERWHNRPILYINKKNEITYNEPKGAIYHAISGDRMLVEKGKPVAGLDGAALHPRTAVGTNANGRWMVMIVVDGRQAGYSEGCTLVELADMLIKFGGVYNAINLDGGGSSTMVMKKNGKTEILNSPIEDGIAGKERQVATHLGLEVK